MAINREYFTLVFKGDIGKFKNNPMNTTTIYGIPEAAGRGDAFDDVERMREALEEIARKKKLDACAAASMQAIARSALSGPCQCKACQRDGSHASDCAVHSVPALPIGSCDCALAPAERGGEQ